MSLLFKTLVLEVEWTLLCLICRQQWHIHFSLDEWTASKVKLDSEKGRQKSQSNSYVLDRTFLPTSIRNDAINPKFN